jgi:hypothetical protein
MHCSRVMNSGAFHWLMMGYSFYGSSDFCVDTVSRSE